MEINWAYLLWWAVLFLLSFVLSLIFVAAVILSLPVDYFVQHGAARTAANRHPAARVLIRLAKNLLGLALVVIGILLSLPGIPGQGILTVLIGVLLLDLPGKRRLMWNLVRHARVQTAMNRIRARFGRMPLEFPDGLELSRKKDPPT